MLNLLKKICAVHGVSGHENPTAELIAKEIEKYTDEHYIDNLGNLIAVKKGSGNGKKIMLCAHMDEIGFIVTFIEEKGQLRVAPIGGIGFSTVSYINVVSESGVSGIIVPDGRVKPSEYTADKFYIEIGAKSKKEAEKCVKIGDVFRFDSDIKKLMGKRICGHPLDDRVGCAIIIKIAELLSQTTLNDDVYFVFSVQEEVGCRGSKTAAFAIGPDISLAFDVTGTGDTPGSAPMAIEVGGGAAIKIKDSSVICDPALVNELIETAKANNIKYQLEILTYGGTDTSSMQMSGTGSRAGAISIPSRYIHSGNELCDLDDLKACVRLAAEYIKGLNK